jgi:dTDP-4-dehydrorhamnose 3,5-epimerase
MNSKEPVLVEVSKGIPCALINPSDKIVRVLVLADVAWRPDENEMLNVKFQDYDWNKWKKE